MSVADKINAARHSIGGSNTSLAVCKATSREIMGPKKKHVDYLVMCTKNEQFDISNLVTLLFERCRIPSWVIVSKALVTLHNLMSNGDERFLVHIGTKRVLLDFEDFQDKAVVTGYDMCAFIRRYSYYLSRKAGAYSEVEYDFCRAKRGRDGVLRTLATPKLLMTLGEIQGLFDSLLDVDVQSSEFINGIINSAFMMLYKDLIKLFACYNDGMIKLLENYYTMNKGECKESLEIYKRFLSRIENVQLFLQVAKDIGVNEDSIPDLVEAPKGLLQALESHYESLMKGQAPTTTIQPNLAPINVPLEREQFNFNDSETIKTTPTTQQYIDESATTLLEAAQVSVQEQGHDTWQTIFEPNDTIEKATSPKTSGSSSSDDLLQLNSVFQSQQPVPQNLFPQQSSTAFQPPVNGFGQTPSNVWGAQAPQGSSGTTNPFDTKHDLITGGSDRDILQPMNTTKPQEEAAGDLHSTLNKVVDSLGDFNLTDTAKLAGSRGYQWTAPKPKVKTGGTDFSLGTTAGTTLPPTSPSSLTGPNIPPMSQVGMARPQQAGVPPGYMQPGMYGPRPAIYGQQPMMRPQANVFPPQNAPSTNPFAPSMPRNQAMF